MQKQAKKKLRGHDVTSVRMQGISCSQGVMNELLTSTADMISEEGLQ